MYVIPGGASLMLFEDELQKVEEFLKLAVSTL